MSGFACSFAGPRGFCGSCDSCDSCWMWEAWLSLVLLRLWDFWGLFEGVVDTVLMEGGEECGCRFEA